MTLAGVSFVKGCPMESTGHHRRALTCPSGVKPEWAARATEKQKLNADLLKATLLGKMVEKVRVEVNRIDEGKEQYLSGLKGGAGAGRT